MSSEPADRERSGSPASGSDSEREIDVIWLKNVKTIAQMYKEGLLQAPKYARVKRAPKVELLERISLFQGDITKLRVDAIVNAANKSLLGGGGVDGAIHAAAGPKLLSECRELNGCLTGQSKITRGYDLPAAHVIHTVGPVYSFDSSSGVEAKAEQLASCYKTSLQLALENSLKSIAFPCVSTGIYGYPIEDATHIALGVARDFAESEEGSKLERIIFTIWTQRDKGVYEDLLPLYFPPVVEEEPSDEPTAEAAATPET